MIKISILPTWPVGCAGDFKKARRSKKNARRHSEEVVQQKQKIKSKASRSKQRQGNQNKDKETKTKV